MCEISLSQRFKVMIVYLFYGVGLGSIISMILALNKRLPDTMLSWLIVTIPVTILYISFRIIKNFSTISVNSEKLTVTSVFGQTVDYIYQENEILFIVSRYRVYQAEYAPLLFVDIMNVRTKKHKRYQLASYNKEQIKKITNLFAEQKSLPNF